MKGFLRRHTVAASAGTLLVFLLAVQAYLPDAFVPLVAAAIIVAPAINWLAWSRLKEKRRLRIASRLAPIVSLARIEQIALLTAIASTATAGLGVFVALRALDPIIYQVFGIHVDPASREIFLVFLSYPPLLLTIPALLWLRTVAELEREEAERLGEVAPAEADA